MMEDKDSPKKYRGFMVELLDRVAEIVDFDYTINIPEENLFGWKVNATHWNGMIGEVAAKVIVNDDVYMCRKLLNNKVKGVKPS